jgi:hypothetical protein
MTNRAGSEARPLAFAFPAEVPPSKFEGRWSAGVSKGRALVVRLELIDAGKSQSEVAGIFHVNRSTICRLAAERRVLAA